MKGVDMRLSAAAFAAIQRATSDPDAVLRREATIFLKTHPAPPPTAAARRPAKR
jgi:hypothetical protein